MLQSRICTYRDCVDVYACIYICIIMYLHSISRQLVSTHSAQFTLTKRPFKRSGFKAEPPKPAKPSSEVKAAPKTATCLDRSQRGRYWILWFGNHPSTGPHATCIHLSFPFSLSLALLLSPSRQNCPGVFCFSFWLLLHVVSCSFVISGVNIGQQEDGDNRIQRLNSTCSSWHLY